MANVGFATLSVIPSFQGFQSRLSAGVAAPMSAAGRSGGRRFGDAAGRQAGDSFKGRFSGALKGFAPLAGLAAGAGGIAFLKSAIDGASDLGEAGTKLQAIYGEAAAEVQDYASTAADSLGQTRLQALDAAATFGTFGKAAGLAGSDLAGFSTELVSLSTDMASFYNTDVETAIQAIGSGLRGEAEPLRQFGVLLDDATLRAEALRQGLVETTKDALTPQQKVLAAHAVIMQQTADAQGDFERTGEGLANQQRKLTAQWEEMKTAVGMELLPAMTGFVSFLNDDALPAIGEVGGAARDAVGAFNDLPTPVKTAAAAFVALRIAAATGLTAATASGVASVSSSMVGLRIRTLLAADAFRTARAGVYEFSGNTGRVIAPVGRLSASLSGLRAAAAGAGGAMRSGLSSAMGLLGGPWGAAMIGATALVGHFWSENQKAKQFVDDLTGSLDAQTGALTENSTEVIKNRLAQQGWLDYADELGISLDLVKAAAEGSTGALAIVRREVEAQQGSQLNPFNSDVWTNDSEEFIATLQNSAAAIDEAKAGQDQLTRFMGAGADAADDSAAATDDVADATRDYAGELKAARDRLKELVDKESERRASILQNRRDQLALVMAQQAGREELKKGKRTLDENTKAGQENLTALYDLADQWNRSSDVVRNKKGAWRDMRRDFVDLAAAMGGGGESATNRARKLADAILDLPDEKKLKVTTPGMDKALADIRLLRKLAAPGGLALETKLRGDTYAGRLNGGPVSAGVPYIVGERRPEVFVPDRAGRIEPRVSGGNTYNVTVVADDPWALKRELDHMARANALGGADFR